MPDRLRQASLSNRKYGTSGSLLGMMGVGPYRRSGGVSQRAGADNLWASATVSLSRTHQLGGELFPYPRWGREGVYPNFSATLAASYGEALQRHEPNALDLITLPATHLVSAPLLLMALPRLTTKSTWSPLDGEAEPGG